jgi:hypothetical protein
MKIKQSPYDTPPWLKSHAASSPNGLFIAKITDAREHSMSNPTVGTLHMSNGLELQRCNPAFIWSDDSQFLSVPQWLRRFGLFLRQSLIIIDVSDQTAFISRFTYWLMQPLKFQGGRLEVSISSSLGISWELEKPLILDIPHDLEKFRKLPIICL